MSAKKSFSNVKKICIMYPPPPGNNSSPFLHGVEIGSKCLPGGGGGMVQDCFCGLRNFFDNQFKMICCLILLNVEVPSDRSWNKVLR